MKKEASLVNKLKYSLLLALAFGNPSFSDQEANTNSEKLLPHSIVDVTKLSTLSEDKKDILRKESHASIASPFLGRIKSHTRMAGFDIYETESKLGNDIVIVKDGYIRGGFSGDYSAIYPKSSMAILDEGPFIAYSEVSLDKGALTYSDGGDIYIDYNLDGVDLVRKRLNAPKTPFPADYVSNSFIYKAFYRDHQCLPIPSILDKVVGMELACCKASSSDKIDLYHIGRPSGEWEAVTSSHPGWRVLEAVSEKCVTTYIDHQNEEWLPVDSFAN